MASELCHSPVAWPSSEKKKKKARINLRTATRDMNKLMLKKCLVKDYEVLTPSPNALPKRRPPRRSSVETFLRLYDEFTALPESSEKLPLLNATPTMPQTASETCNSRQEPMQLRRSGTSFPNLDKLSKEVFSLDSNPDTPLAARKCSPQVFSDMSSDDEQFSIILPLSQRIAKKGITPSSARPRKTRPVLTFDDSSDDDESRAITKRRPFLKDKSSSSENDDKSRQKSTVRKLSEKSIEATTQSNSVMTKNHRPIKNHVFIFDDSSSDDELPGLPRIKSSDSLKGNSEKELPDLPTGSIPKASSLESKTVKSEDELPNLPRYVDPKNDYLKIRTVSSDDELPRLPKLTGRNTKPLKAVIFSSDDELPDLPKATVPKNKTPKFQIVSSDDELPDLPKRSVLKNKTPKQQIIFSDDDLPDLPSQPVPKFYTKSKENVNPALYSANLRCDSPTEAGLSTPKTYSTPKPSIPVYSSIKPVPNTLPKIGKITTGTLPINVQQRLFTQNRPNLISNDASAEELAFLKSLSEDAPPSLSSALYKKMFQKYKDELVQKLYAIFNRTVYDNKLPESMDITWNVRLTTTAGFCYNKIHRDHSRTARIELSTKVCDSADRVRDTLLHELCHAASWLLLGAQTGHGREFQLWATKAKNRFPFLPMVARCHNYEIRTKFVYKCMLCPASIGRHSKSLNINRKVCGRCGGRYQLLVNGVVKDSPVRGTPDFAKFVKENYAYVKTSNGKLNHVEIMKKLAGEFVTKARLA